MDVTGIYRTCHPTAADYTLFSSACETFSRIDNKAGHKIRQSKFKKTEIITKSFLTTMV